MDVHYELRGIAFRWDAENARANADLHGVTIEQAVQVFFDPFDPFVRYVEASRNDEVRDGAVGMDFECRLMFVLHLEVEAARQTSSGAGYRT